jgi:hypothetical protein
VAARFKRVLAFATMKAISPHEATPRPLASIAPPGAPLGRHRPTCAPHLPEGQGGAATVNHSSARGSRPESQFDKLRMGSPCCACAAGPPVHSITLSAPARKASGIVTPIAFAVLRLTTSSNLVGYWMGSSPGFAPRRMRST